MVGANADHKGGVYIASLQLGGHFDRKMIILGA
jgi:hypothetical protein